MKLSGHVQKVSVQGIVSQICYLCSSLNFIKCRKSFMKKIAKSSRFFVIKKRTTLPCMYTFCTCPENFINFY